MWSEGARSSPANFLPAQREDFEGAVAQSTAAVLIPKSVTFWHKFALLLMENLEVVARSCSGDSEGEKCSSDVTWNCI